MYQLALNSSESHLKFKDTSSSIEILPRFQRSLQLELQAEFFDTDQESSQRTLPYQISIFISDEFKFLCSSQRNLDFCYSGNPSIANYTYHDKDVDIPLNMIQTDVEFSVKNVELFEAGWNKIGSN